VLLVKLCLASYSPESSPVLSPEVLKSSEALKKSKKTHSSREAAENFCYEEGCEI
jgi:hypothetical protein